MDFIVIPIQTSKTQHFKKSTPNHQNSREIFNLKKKNQLELFGLKCQRSGSDWWRPDYAK